MGKCRNRRGMDDRLSCRCHSDVLAYVSQSPITVAGLPRSLGSILARKRPYGRCRLRFTTQHPEHIQSGSSPVYNSLGRRHRLYAGSGLLEFSTSLVPSESIITVAYILVPQLVQIEVPMGTISLHNSSSDCLPHFPTRCCGRRDSYRATLPSLTRSRNRT